MSIFYFGEKIDGYETRVFNEREVRASAGILFFFAGISFMNSWLIGNFAITKFFVVVFLIDFFIRIFINPKYAPSLILGRLMVRHQAPEYVGAPQKRWAWVIGFVLASVMSYLLVLNNLVGPINLFVCLACLSFLFFEAVFGICFGCALYNLFHKQEAQNCPGGACKTEGEKEDIQKINFAQVFILLSSLVAIIWIAVMKNHEEVNTVVQKSQQISLKTESDKNCTPPQWAIDIGHGEKWKLHHGCK